MALNSRRPELRELDGTEPALHHFACRDYRQPWTEYIEEAIRSNVAYLVRSGYVAIGAWIESRLVGVAIYKPAPQTWRIALMATADGFNRQGIALALKTSVLARAQTAGAFEVVSYVAFANDPMINLNTKLGAEIRQDPEEFNQLICLIRLK